MLFITNRALNQSHRSRRERSITFRLEDNSALPSVFFCRRHAESEYSEVLSEHFFQEIRESPVEQLLLYFHGFNELPENSAFNKAATLQRAFDDYRPHFCHVVPFLWPCKSQETIVDRYYDDQLAADMSGYAFARVLGMLHEWQRGLVGEPCPKRINVLAHSMGTRVLRSTMRVWSRELLRHEPPMLFRNLFLAASDIVNSTFEDPEGRLLTMATRNVVVYFAADDLALRASKVANAAQASRRLGHTGPYDMTKVPANVYAKDCDDFNATYDAPNGHTYFLNAPDGTRGRVLTDMIGCMQTGRPSGIHPPSARLFYL